MNMMKHLLLAATLLAASAFTGCQALQNFQDEHPVAYDLIKGSAKAVLLSQLPEITSSETGQAALRSVIDQAFAEAAAPEDVALALADGVAAVYPDDTSLQHMIAAEWSAALRGAATVPASGPGDVPGARSYQLELADALSADLSQIYRFDPTYTVTVASGREW